MHTKTVRLYLSTLAIAGCAWLTLSSCSKSNNAPVQAPAPATPPVTAAPPVTPPPAPAAPVTPPPAPAETPAPAPEPAPAAASAAPPTEIILDYGNNTSETLTGKAWNGFTNEHYREAVAYAKHCIEMYSSQALDMQKGLTALPTGSTNDISAKYWALNDVGTCYFIMGSSLEKLQDTKGAIDAFKYLSDNLSYSQCWDPKGWFWQPAAGARKKLAELQFDSQ